MNTVSQPDVASTNRGNLEQAEESTPPSATKPKRASHPRYSCSLDLREVIGELGAFATELAFEANRSSNDEDKVAQLVGYANYYVLRVEEELAEAQRAKVGTEHPNPQKDADRLAGDVASIRVVAELILQIIGDEVGNDEYVITGDEYRALHNSVDLLRNAADSVEAIGWAVKLGPLHPTEKGADSPIRLDSVSSVLANADSKIAKLHADIAYCSQGRADSSDWLNLIHLVHSLSCDLDEIRSDLRLTKEAAQ